jgi:formamidopyrimidine-DNA glycosylase
MSAGRVRYLLSGEKGPKSPAFRLTFQGGGELVLTEAGAKKRAGVWLLTPEAAEAELEHLGPEALGLGAERLGEILAEQPRRLHSLLRDQRVISGIGRAWANEILHTAQLSPFAPAQGLSADGGSSGSPPRSTPSWSAASSYASAARRTRKVYRVHKRLHEPCYVCGTPIERVDFEEHTIFYCPQCQTGGRLLKDRRMSRLLR